MVRIALLHTVQSVANSFGRRLKEYLREDIRVYNFWDEFLSVNPNEIGEFTAENKERLLLDLKSMAMTDADLIVVTCSTLSPHLEEARKTIQIPIVAIDDEMSAKAVKKSNNILVIASAKSAVEPVMDKLSLEGKLIGKMVKVTGVVIEEAFEALKKNNLTGHNEIVRRTVSQMDTSEFDLIVLAQASLESCKEDIRRITGKTTIAGTSFCLKEIKKEVKRMAL